jgi:hypothetical protein
VLYQPGEDSRRDELLGPCGAICKYESEMEAIRNILEVIGTRLDDGSVVRADIVVFTDAVSIIQAIYDMGEWPWRLKRVTAAISGLSVRHEVKFTLMRGPWKHISGLISQGGGGC